MKSIFTVILFFVATQFVISQNDIDRITKYENYQEYGRITDISILGGDKYLNVSSNGVFLLQNNCVNIVAGTKNETIYLINNDKSHVWCVKDRGEVFNLNNPTVRHLFASDSYNVKDIAFDESDNILFPDPSELGFIQFNKKNQKYTYFTDDKEQTASVNCLYVDNDNKIWIGTNKGIYTYNEKDKTFEFETSRKAPKYKVNQIVGNDSVMFCAGHDKIWKYHRERHEWKILVSNHGTTAKSNVQRNKLKKIEKVEDMFLDHGGNLWIASSKIIRYDVRGYWETFDFYDDYKNKIENKKNEIIPLSIRTEKYKSDSTKIWIGTKTSGLWCFKTKTITTATSKKNIVFIIDSSLKKSELRKIKQTIKLWLAYLNPLDQISIIGYDYVDSIAKGSYFNYISTTANDSRSILKKIRKIKSKDNASLCKLISTDTVFESRDKKEFSYKKIENYEIIKYSQYRNRSGELVKESINITHENAYLVALKIITQSYIDGGNNRIIVFTDGRGNPIDTKLKTIIKETYIKTPFSIDYITFDKNDK